MSVRDAAKHVSEILGVPRSRVYQLALAIKESVDADLQGASWCVIGSKGQRNKNSFTLA